MADNRRRMPSSAYLKEEMTEAQDMALAYPSGARSTRSARSTRRVPCPASCGQPMGQQGAGLVVAWQMAGAGNWPAWPARPAGPYAARSPPLAPLP